MRYFAAKCFVSLGLFVAAATPASITYTYTSSPNPPIGSVSGYFSLPDAAVADGIVTAADIEAAHFSVVGPTPPLLPMTIELSEFIPFIGIPYDGEAYIDRATGEFLDDYYIGAIDGETGQSFAILSSRWAMGAPGQPTEYAAPATVVISGGAPPRELGTAVPGIAANITYRFTSNGPVPIAGTLDGYIVVPKSAIADGVISRSEFAGGHFTLSGTQPPVADVEVTLNEIGPIISQFRDNAIHVNPNTGAILHDFMLNMNILPVPDQRLRVFPHRYDVTAFSGTRSVHRAPLNLSYSGANGVVTPLTPVPALGSIAFWSMAALLMLLAARRLRRPE